MTTNTSNTGGVVDASILEMPDIPANLQRTGFGPAAPAVEETTSEGNEERHPKGITSEDEVPQTTSEEKLAVNEALAHSPPEQGHNRPATEEEMRRDFLKDVNTFGRLSGQGASALPRLGLRVLRAAADGLISTEKPKGGGKSDAVLIYEAYAAQDSKHAEHTDGGKKANAAKLNAIIGMGVMTTIDPVAVGDRTVRIREEMEAQELKPKALFAGLVDVARAQQDSDTELTDDAIRAALGKPVRDVTLEKEWEAIQKRVDNLISGEGSHGLKDQSERALKIGQLVAEHVKNYKSEGADDDLVKELIERGYTETQAKEIVKNRPSGK